MARKILGNFHCKKKKKKRKDENPSEKTEFSLAFKKNIYLIWVILLGLFGAIIDFNVIGDHLIHIFETPTSAVRPNQGSRTCKFYAY